jgi:hypothetical protein
MANGRKARFHPAICLVVFTMLLHGCAGAPSTQQAVVTEYLLQKSGFQPWVVNEETPKRKALLDVIPKGKIVTFQMNGSAYHVYGDENSHTLYVGDAAAYQKYLSLAKDKQLCERVDATNSAGFWSCFDESQKGGGGQRGK